MVPGAAVQPNDEVRHVVVRLTVVEVRDREAEAGVLHERIDALGACRGRTRPTAPTSVSATT